MSISKDLVEVIKSADKKETKGYDTQATVTRVEGSTVWVHIPGGVDETPVKKTVSAKEGDVVQVRVSGGSAYLMGNASSPPTDDTTALLATEYAKSANMAAESAVQSAKTAADAAADAVATANSVRDIADEAKAHADEAKEHADDAAEAAEGAAISANSALTQLSIVEDVVGTLNWISEHGTYMLTRDSQIVPEKVYFTRTGSGTSQDPYIYTPVIEPKEEELGMYYELVIDDAVSTYIAMHLALTEEGLYVMNQKNKWKVLIANDGVYIIDDRNKKVAKYQDVITLGVDDGSQSILVEDYHSIRMFDKENAALLASPDTASQAVPYFWISDLREASGRVEKEDVFKGDGSNRTFVLSALADTTGSIYAKYGGRVYSGTSIRTYEVGNKYTEVRFADSMPVPAENETVTITYRSVSKHNKAYTLGNRLSGHSIGCHSFARGLDNEASGFLSHADGNNNIASGLASHAEGSECIASNMYAHAEGNASEAAGSASHAEGTNTHAYASGAHSEGGYTRAIGKNSHASGEETYAYCSNSSSMGFRTRSCGRNRLVIGMYNDDEYINPTAKTVTDERGEYAFIIGNGTSVYDRSNAFSVKWDGVPYCRNLNNDYGSIFNLIYPVGSIYMSVNSVSPATLFGGTWERIQDRFLLAAGSTYSAGGTGGSADAVVVSHTHSTSGTAASNGAHTHSVSGTAASAGAHTHSMNNLWSNGSGSSTAYTMQSNRTLTTRNTASAGAHTHSVSGTAASAGAHTHSVSGTAASTGVAATGKNMPPYLTVYMWKRTA